VLIDGEILEEENSFLLKSARELKIGVVHAEKIIQTYLDNVRPIEHSAE
jgi:hypothetical protein